MRGSQRGEPPARASGFGNREGELQEVGFEKSVGVVKVKVWWRNGLKGGGSTRERRKKAAAATESEVREEHSIIQLLATGCGGGGGRNGDGGGDEVGEVIRFSNVVRTILYLRFNIFFC